MNSPSIAYDFPRDGVSKLPRVGSVEMWEIAYPSMMMGSHPVHIHLSQFQVDLRNNSWAGKNFYDFDPTEGDYVWHCHLLNHEDNEMMRPYRMTR